MRHFGAEDAPPNETSGVYRKKAAVTLWGPMETPFTCTNREGRDLRGQAGDFLAEDGHGSGYYPISAEFHAANYEEVKK